MIHTTRLSRRQRPPLERFIDSLRTTSISRRTTTALQRARCGSGHGRGDVVVAAEKQDCRDSFNPPEQRPLIAVDRLLLDAWSGYD